MDIARRIAVPTGDILVVRGEHGWLECLSLGDYGKDVNLKCDALGLSRDIERVVHTDLMPLEKKWVVTISTQYGCMQNCSFCDVPYVGGGRNASFGDLWGQVQAGLSLHPGVEHTERLNIHFARMGEPTWNPNVLDAAKAFSGLLGGNVHPVVSTMMPRKNKWLPSFLLHWMKIKNELYEGNAGLQISINSTDDAERQEMFRDGSWDLDAIAMMLEGSPVVGRKITLNFAVAHWTIDPARLLEIFDPERFIIKLTPMHKTRAAQDRGIKTAGDYTTMYGYMHHEQALKEAGYDVLVFVASREEDESRITCGNAILSGTEAAFGTEMSAEGHSIDQGESDA